MQLENLRKPRFIYLLHLLIKFFILNSCLLIVIYKISFFTLRACCFILLLIINFFFVLEVARTRLREEGSKYKRFWQTLSLVYQEEGHKGLYRGLSIQLIRQIPNTAIMMATYEAVVYFLTKYFNSRDASNFYDVEKT